MVWTELCGPLLWRQSCQCVVRKHCLWCRGCDSRYHQQHLATFIPKERVKVKKRSIITQYYDFRLFLWKITFSDQILLRSKSNSKKSTPSNVEYFLPLSYWREISVSQLYSIRNLFKEDFSIMKLSTVNRIYTKTYQPIQTQPHEGTFDSQNIWNFKRMNCKGLLLSKYLGGFPLLDVSWMFTWGVLWPNCGYFQVKQC